MTPSTLALAHYDRHVPFFDRTVDLTASTGLTPLDVGDSIAGRDGTDRHERMFRDLEFAAAEVSLSSYLMARDRGMALTAIPVFPRRLFGASQIWCPRGAGIGSPADLAGRRVGINTFQTTLSVLVKGDLGRSWGVSWRDVRWVTAREEVLPFDMPEGGSVERVPDGRSLADLLLAGEIDALVLPHPPRRVLESSKVGRLLTDVRAEEARYVRTYGYYPIMHLVALRADVARERPDMARALFDAFAKASELCRVRWEDPNWSLLAWGRMHLEAQARELGPDIWEDGLARNRSNLEWFIAQELDQGLIERPLTVEELFDPSTLDS